MNYSVPKSGFYKVSAKFARFEKTENLVEQVNHNRKWFQFWKPKMILTTEYKLIETLDANEIRFLKEGDVVSSPIFRINTV